MLGTWHSTEVQGKRMSASAARGLGADCKLEWSDLDKKLLCGGWRDRRVGLTTPPSGPLAPTSLRRATFLATSSGEAMVSVRVLP
jgi:hypothetical protein